MGLFPQNVLQTGDCHSEVMSSENVGIFKVLLGEKCCFLSIVLEVLLLIREFVAQ